MSNTTFQIRRTSVAGRAANSTTLPNPGELAINMTDRIMYSTNGTSIFEIGANLTNQNISGNLTVNAIIANGTIGTSGQVLTTNSSGVYWSTVTGGEGGGSGTVTSVGSGDGLTGGPITTSGTISVLANSGIIANSTGLHVNTTFVATTGKAIAMAIVFG